MRILLAFLLVLPACFAVDATVWRKHFEQAVQLRERGHYAQARILFQECVSQAESFGENDPRLGYSLADLGYIEMAFGRYREAESLLNRSVRILESHPKAKIYLSNALNNLSLVYLNYEKRYRNAEKALSRALDLTIEIQGPSHSNVGSVLSNLATSRYRQGDLSGAKPLYERAIAMIATSDSTRSTILGNLAMISFASRNYEKALSYFEESVASLHSLSGPDHPVLIVPLCNLAQTYVVLNQRDVAEVALRRALAISDARIGESNRVLPRILESLADLRRKAGDKQEAKALEVRAQRIESAAGARARENSLVHVSELVKRKRD